MIVMIKHLEQFLKFDLDKFLEECEFELLGNEEEFEMIKEENNTGKEVKL